MHLVDPAEFYITIDTGNNGYVKLCGVNKVHYGLCENVE